MKSFKHLSLDSRVSKLESGVPGNGERGAWEIITDSQENEVIVTSARLGRRTFPNRAAADLFIEKNHRGKPVMGPSFIHVKIV